MLKKDKTFQWGKEQEKAFDLLKEKLCEKPILIHPNVEDYFYINTDASKKGLGCVIQQERDGGLKPVAFYSRRCNNAESKLSAFELEALALRFAAEKTKYYTYDNPKVIVQTDHKNLQYIKKFKNKDNKLARIWFDIVDVFGKAEFRYVKGKDNIVADVLSRVALVEKVNIKSLQENDKEIEKLKNDKNYEVRNGIVAYKGKPVIPESARFQILYEVHEKNSHLSMNGVIDQLCSRIYWPGIYKDIRNWIQKCKICQMKKISRLKQHESNIPHSVGNTWKRIHLDFVGPIDKSIIGNEYILTVIDAFSKFSFAYAVKKADSKNVCEKLEKLFLLVGNSEEIYTDKGKHFDSEMINDICKMFNLKHFYTSPYNPQANGICERFNATLCDSIAVMVENNLKDWDSYVDLAVSIYNNKKQGSTGITPYEILFGEIPRLKLDSMLDNSKEDKTISDFMKEKYEKMKRNEILVKQRLKEMANKSKKEDEPKLKIGDKVLLKIYQRGNSESRKKFSDRFKGPFFINDIVSGVATLISNEGKEYGKWKLRDLKKYHEEDKDMKEFRNDRKQVEFKNEDLVENDDDDEYVEKEEIDEKEIENKSNDKNESRRSKRERRRPKRDGIDLDWLELDEYFIKFIKL